MILTLEVTGPEAEALGAAARRVFNACGGTIGRLPDNAWVLPDPYVSSRHAIIRYHAGAFWIEDTSTNGIFINAPDNSLVKGEPYQLKSGDWIFIEPYEIRATLTAEARPGSSPFDDLFPPTHASPVSSDAGTFAGFLPPRQPPPPGPGQPAIPADIFGIPAADAELDPLKLLDAPPVRTPYHGSDPSRLDSGPVWADPYAPPPISAPPVVTEPAPPPASTGGSHIPENWWDTSVQRKPEVKLTPSGAEIPRPRPRQTNPPAPAAMPVERPRPVAPAPPPPAPVAATAPPQARAGSGDLAAFLEGAGLPNVPVSPELAQSFGRMFRVVVAGVMDMLRARQQTKGALGIEQTLFKPANNNPLKFSANVDDALHNLLVKRNAAYLGPVEAFEDAFADVKIHQMAMLHGMRVAFEAMLEQFDPDRLEDTFNRQIKKGALVSMPAKLRYWDLYREKMQDMLKDADGSFRELFGDTFAAAYDEQLKRLKSGGRS